MEEKKNNKGLIITLIVIICLLAVLCTLLATGVISFKEKKPETLKPTEVVEQTTEKEQCDCPETTTTEQKPADNKISVTKNGKVISNKIPSDLIGYYFNNYEPDKTTEYINITKDKIEFSFATGGAGTPKKLTAERIYINYLEDSDYVTIELTVGSNIYSYFGRKDKSIGKYLLKTIESTAASGEGRNCGGDHEFEYPFSIDKQEE